MPLPFALPALKALPWGLIAKAGILAAVFAFGIGIGCTQQSKRDQGKIDAANVRTDKALADAGRLKAQGDVLADQLRTIDLATKAQKAAADARVAAAQAQAKAAAEESETARNRAIKVEADLAKAMQNPDCAKLLRTRSCAAFR